MYALLHELLSDRKGGEVFICFGLWHWCFILLALAAVVIAALNMRKMDGTSREWALDHWINLAFGLYIADFFLMPFAYESIDMEKLPFHVCTAMCVACFLSRRWEPLKPWESHLALLGFVSNLVYLIYPAGVMWHRVSPFSYRVIQTLLFHAQMTVYGFVVLWENPPRPGRRELAVLAAMTAWAILGNRMYNGTSGDYDHFFNWFFVIRDPFYILPEHIAPWLMPPLNILIFFAAEHLTCAILRRLRK